MNNHRPLDEDTATNEDSTGSSTAPTSAIAFCGSLSVTVRDVDFEDTQLIPRGVDIYREVDLSLGFLAGPSAYFGSENPSNPSQSREFYRSIVQKSRAVERDIDDSIFLPMGADFVQSVQRVYLTLARERVPAAEFKAYAY